MIFQTKRDDEKQQQINAFSIQLNKLQMDYNLLDSQYKEIFRSLQKAKQGEDEALRFLYDLENMICRYNHQDGHIRIEDIAKKSPKERVFSIIEAVNSQKNEFLQLIETLKNRLDETQKELEEYADMVQEMGDTINNLRSREWERSNHSFESSSGSTEITIPPHVENKINHADLPEAPSLTVPLSELSLPPTLGTFSVVHTSTVMPEIQRPKYAPLIVEEKKEEEVIVPKPVTKIKNDHAEIRRQEMINEANRFLLKNEDKISDMMWAIILVMGSQGLSERPEIEEYMKQHLKIEIASSTLSNAFNMLESLGVIDKESMSTGIRHNFYVHMLTVLGYGLYCKEFEKEYRLKLSEKKKITQMHDNAQHGYFIKDIKMLLKEMRYSSVTDDRKNNTFPVKNGEYWIPDIIAVNELGEKEYFECEFGNHTQMDFNKKIYKASQVTNNIKFVTRNKDAQKNVENLTRNWFHNAKENNLHPERMTFYVITSKNLFVRKSFGEPFNPLLIM